MPLVNFVLKVKSIPRKAWIILAAGLFLVCLAIAVSVVIDTVQEIPESENYPQKK